MRTVPEHQILVKPVGAADTGDGSAEPTDPVPVVLLVGGLGAAVALGVRRRPARRSRAPDSTTLRPVPRRAEVVGPLSPAVARLLGAVVLGVCVLLACSAGASPPSPALPRRAGAGDVDPGAGRGPAGAHPDPGDRVDSALIGLGLQADGTLQVPADGSVAGWFTGAPTPGEHGPAVIAAHVDWNHAPGVFFRLRDLDRGDEVAVVRADGSTARFVVLAVERSRRTRSRPSASTATSTTPACA